MLNEVSSARRSMLAAVSALSVALTIAACGPSSGSPTQTGDALVAADVVLAPFGLDGLDAVELVDHLDALPVEERPAGLFASVRQDEVQLTGADGATASLALPADTTYVSFAPYVEQTHECYFHSLTTCTGELGGETFAVVATDLDTGEVLVDGDVEAFPNGFIGLWLPTGTDVQVEVSIDGRSATETFATHSAGDATCVTTMQLV